MVVLETDPHPAGEAREDSWLIRFHAGDRETLESLYREHFATVEAAVGRVLGGADRESVIHSVFCDLCGSERMRRSFREGSVSAWLRTVARNRALDFARRAKRDALMAPEVVQELAEQERGGLDDQAALHELVERLRAQLPEKLWSVFKVRFLEQQSQREAARCLGIRRTTLAYREHLVRKVLERWAREGEI